METLRVFFLFSSWRARKGHGASCLVTGAISYTREKRANNERQRQWLAFMSRGSDEDAIAQEDRRDRIGIRRTAAAAEPALDAGSMAAPGDYS